MNLKKLLGKKEKTSVNMRLRDPDNYYMNIWVNKTLAENLKLISQCEKIPVKKAAELLLTKGISVYLGNAVAENNLVQQSGKKYEHSSNIIRKVKEKLKESGTSNYIIKKNGL